MTLSTILEHKQHHLFKNMFDISMIKKVIKDDVDIVCADDFTRKCHSIIIEFMMNYEEQILIMSIKKNQQCFICQISFQKRKNFMSI